MRAVVTLLLAVAIVLGTLVVAGGGATALHLSMAEALVWGLFSGLVGAMVCITVVLGRHF